VHAAVQQIENDRKKEVKKEKEATDIYDCFCKNL